CMLALLEDLYKAPMKYTNPFEPFTLSIGLIQAGTVQNVIPDTAEFAGTARFFDEEKSALPFLKHMAESAECFSKLYGCAIDYTVRHGKPLINNPDLTKLAWNAFSAVVGSDHVVEGMPAMGSESFPAYANYAPACFGKLGIANPEVGSGAEIHNQFFDIDEKAMITGAAATVTFALAFLNNKTEIKSTPFLGNVTAYYAGSLKEVHFGE
ncbi:MAG TPA: M20/M25/M40 family metallo-hydrolase, partial [Bacillota bacterium]|nr:M20/M25/M40 family metallo-hydrolase [Bacillota bacterium]